jgi:hypothetical protein
VKVPRLDATRAHVPKYFSRADYGGTPRAPEAIARADATAAAATARAALAAELATVRAELEALLARVDARLSNDPPKEGSVP